MTKNLDEFRKRADKHFFETLEKKLEKFFPCPCCGAKFSNIWDTYHIGLKDAEVAVNYNCEDSCRNSMNSQEEGTKAKGLWISIKKILERKEENKKIPQKEKLF